MRMRTRSVLFGLSAAVLAVGIGPARAAASGAPGTLDPTFGDNGVTLTDLGAPGVPTNAVRQSTGDIVVAGGFGVARFRPDGRLDRAFGTDGVAATGFNDIGLGPSGVAVQPDGKVVWSGGTTRQVGSGTVTDIAVARFDADGGLDPGFGSGGRFSTEFFGTPLQGALETAAAVLVQPDGKILVGGSARQGQSRFAPQQGALARLNPDGTLDPTFGGGGRVLSTTMGAVTTLGLDAAGNVFVLPTHVELSPAGQLDPAVSPAAIVASSAGGHDAFLPSGQYVSGRSVGVARHDVDVQVLRFNGDGGVASTGPTFDYTATGGQASDSASAITVQANGQAVVGGSHFAGTSILGLARVNADGALDAGFGNGGKLTANLQGNDTVTALLVQPDGKIIAVGMSQDNTTGRVYVALLRYLA
jgi:uncharacterized delta-60 repeat protein